MPMVSASRRLSFFVGRVDFGCGAYQDDCCQAKGPGESIVRIL